MKLMLPYPVSANRYWRSFKARNSNYVNVVISDEAKVFKQECGWMAKKAGLISPVSGHLELRIVLHPIKPKTIRLDSEVRCMDLDNALKVSIDALKGICYHDDNQIRRLCAEKGEPIEHGGLSVEILRYEQRKEAA